MLVERVNHVKLVILMPVSSNVYYLLGNLRPTITGEQRS